MVSAETKSTITDVFVGKVTMAIIVHVSSSICYNNGVCRNKVNDYRCICPKGYYGDHCEQTPCTNVNCNFGSCVIDGSTWRCQCPTGHHGTYCEQYPRDCEDFIENESKSGIYQIYPSDTRGFETYCDMETEGGGWLVFQKRQDGSVNFFRNWTDYKNGFGDVTGEFWLGNVKIHEITTIDEYELYILMEDLEGEQRYARYKTFYIGDIQSKFALEIGGYSGNAGNSLDTTNHKSQPFSTLDRDSSSNCPKLFKGGWWYGNCHHSNLNGLYLNGPHKSYADGIEWYHWKGHYYSLKKTQMMIRRRR
ncbi:microfibril-associated glycoprotein 4-like [Mytilus edulis]|uniref:microfibril-associated glycoprotein 4-like n=1 Tax=Mytilus edulis TaxID=6550 RepID=UPI0039F06EC0